MSDDKPQGWMKHASIVLWLVVLGMLLAWIWLGDWRWGATAGVVSLVAVTLFGLLFSGENHDRRDGGSPMEPRHPRT